MLVEFRVKNFRSLRDGQVLSLIASKDTALPENTLETNLTIAPRLLKSAAIYGANASGKSNLIKALKYMRSMVLRSTTLSPEQIFMAPPFRLDAKTESQPTEFEVTVILNSVRYQYGFSIMRGHVVAEFLLVYQAFKPQRWFERRFDEASGEDVYEFGPGLKGAKNAWESETGPNALFLSVAVKFGSEALRPVFDWFTTGVSIFNGRALIGLELSPRMLEHPDDRKKIRDFLRAADISIADIEVRARKIPGQNEIERDQLIFSHVTESGQAEFDLWDESSGTRNLLSLVGPVLEVLREGRTLVIDELDTSLHPLLMRELVRLFHRNEINVGGAQLIFTTHDTSLLEARDLLRRDQVWLIEKDDQQASTLVALTEFSPRKNEALGRGYLSGRYGGVPVLDEGLGLARNET
ncbi:MAG: AAA family ATPase [Zoogloeaceae bacterium]|jgi:AAA15 family ATPase/GTPase|nr:AAA family ATPase [Zoogloeaceae bacterium]